MGFDEVALIWDNENRIERAKVISEKIKSSINIAESRNAMEFGCGTGLISFNLYQLLNSVTLFDSSPKMLEVLESKIQKVNAVNMFANGNKDDVYAKKYDFIYTSMALHHVVELEDQINKFFSVLTKGGSLCIVDLDKEDGTFHKEDKNFDGHNGFEHQELKKIVEKHGMKVVKLETFYEDTRVIDGKDVSYSLFILVAVK